MDDTTDPGELALRRRTALAVSIAAREIHEFIAGFIPQAPALLGALIDGSRHLRLLGNRFRAMTVLHARIVEHATWDVIAGRLRVDVDTAIALYEDIEMRWRAGDPAPWAPAVYDDYSPQRPVNAAGPIEVSEDTTADLASDLDAYVLRHVGRTRFGEGERPVSDGLP